MPSKSRKMKSSKKTKTMKMSIKEKYAECPDATYHGLHHWFKHLHEELGWMVLAKDYGMMDKIATYKHSIQRLECALRAKMANLKDADKKEDIKIMHHNILILWEHVQKDFA